VPSFNPSSVLDLGSYLDRLQQTYTFDRKTLVQDLKTCLEASSDTVESDCQPIIENKAKNVFEYYDVGGPGNDFFAQQNTLALQYTAVEEFLDSQAPLVRWTLSTSTSCRHFQPSSASLRLGVRQRS
jgi:hypothetical protein